MKYCCYCSAALIYQVPDDDNLRRYICTVCDVVHYQNPKIVAGCLPVWENQVLLCKRAIEPRFGYWTLPAGFMELGETTMEGAMRETFEEANARVEVESLFAVFNLPHVDQVYMMFRSRLLDLDFSPGIESQAVQLYKEEDIPWNELAFTTIRETLRLYYEDRRKGCFRMHIGDVTKKEGNYNFVETLLENSQS